MDLNPIFEDSWLIEDIHFEFNVFMKILLGF